MNDSTRELIEAEAADMRSALHGWWADMDEHRPTLTQAATGKIPLSSIESSILHGAIMLVGNELRCRRLECMLLEDTYSNTDTPDTPECRKEE